MKMGGIVISLFVGLFVSQTQAIGFWYHGANGAWHYQNVVAKLFSTCPTHAGKVDFDLDKYMGHWYEIERYPNWWQRGSCNDAVYALKDGGFDIITSEIRNGNLKELTVEGKDDPSSTDLSNLLTQKYPWPPVQYLVIDTDYDSYAVVYSCQYYVITRFEQLWIMSRERTMSDDTLQSIHTHLDGMGIKTSHLIKTKTDGCD